EVVDREEGEALECLGKAKIEGTTSPKVTVLGMDSTTQKMTRYGSYAGLAMENICLGIESDILRIGLQNCEDAGYPIVYHVYDSATAEVPRGGPHSVEEMERLLLKLPKTYDGLPLAAHGWRGKRFRKG